MLVSLESCNRGESRGFLTCSFIPQVLKCPFLYPIFINTCIFVPLFSIIVFIENWHRVFLAGTMPRLSFSLKPFSWIYKLWRCLLHQVDDFTFLEVDRTVYIALKQDIPNCLCKTCIFQGFVEVIYYKYPDMDHNYRDMWSSICWL